MLRRLVSLALALAALMAVFLPAAAYAEGDIMYVYTDNGKTLNVRRDPSTTSDVIGHLPFGEAVSVRMSMANGWTVIDWAGGDGYVAYVQSRFLMSYRPSPVTPSGGTTPGTAQKDTLSGINAEFRAARKVAVPFTVFARPSRATGWVNLRWAPSADAERITTCPQGKELVVLAELKTWYQVQDPATGMIGFISKKYVSVR